MASVRTALLLVPPASVVLVMAVRCLCRVAARKLTAMALAQFALPPSSSSFRYCHDAMLRELPVALYSSSSRRTSCGGGGVGDENEEEEELAAAAECVFCLSGIEEGSEVRELKCRHLFHRGCLDRWLLVARPMATCPLCRCRLLTASSASAALARAPWEEDYDEGDGGEGGEGEEDDADSDSDMMLFVACVHSRSSWLWPS